MPQLTIETFLQQPQEVAKLNQWMFDNIQPYVKGRTLEMCSGSGALSSFFIERGMPIHLSDFEKTNRERLRARFDGLDALRGVHRVDYLRSDFQDRYLPELGVFNTIIGVNIIEHGLYLLEEVRNAQRLLVPGGQLIMALPSYTALYPGFELPFEELKQFDRKTIQQALRGFKIGRTRHFSCQGIAPPKFLPSGLSVIVIAKKAY